MSKYRLQLPQLQDRFFLTDSGLETTLIFHQGMDLPYFAAFDLLRTEQGTATLREYYDQHAALARQHDLGAVLEAPTWRASADWGSKLGYDAAMLRALNRRAIALMQEVRQRWETPRHPMVISGNLGPRGDGYHIDKQMTVEEARTYHSDQVATFADTDADLVSVFTMNYVEEAAGVILAARDWRIPVVASFTLETDGQLPSGESLADAISRTDALTDHYAAYYMINCAHPDHFRQRLHGDAPWLRRIAGIRANASRRSHAELDESTELDAGNPQELGQQYMELKQLLPALRVVGGCCGTDHRHVHAMAQAFTVDASAQRQRNDAVIA